VPFQMVAYSTDPITIATKN